MDLAQKDLGLVLDAAAEMIRRAAHMSGGESTAQVWGGTFHAMANRLLRIYGSALGIAPEFTVMDQAVR